MLLDGSPDAVARRVHGRERPAASLVPLIRLPLDRLGSHAVDVAGVRTTLAALRVVGDAVRTEVPRPARAADVQNELLGREATRRRLAEGLARHTSRLGVV